MKNIGPQTGQDLSNSRFYMWRCVIAIAHVDGRFDKDERAYAERVIKNMARAYGMTEEHHKTFAEDMETPPDIFDLLRHINDPAARADLIYFGGLMARIDGILSPNEEEILKVLHINQMAGIDMDALRIEVKKYLDEQNILQDIEKAELHPQGGLSQALDIFFEKLNIDLLD